MGMKYKVGDKVRIKPKEWYDANKDKVGAISKNESLYSFVKPMSKYLGMEATITEVEELAYSIDLDGNCHSWHDWMFEDKPAEPTLFDRIKSAIIEAGKQAPIIIEQTEDGGVKISPLEEKEEDLPIDTPCMVADCLDNWCFRYYAYKGKVFMNGLKSKNEGKVMKYDYIIPFDKFNPADIEESLKYNIVK